MKKNLPPKLFTNFFRWYCNPKFLDRIEGDLLEEYHQQCDKIGKRKADIKFALDVLLLLRPTIFKPIEGYNNLNTYGMLKNYFKIAVRNLLKYQSFTAINLFGLVSGLSSAFILALIAHQQLSFDSVHKETERIHLVYKERATPNGVQQVYDTWVPLLDVMMETYPEIETGARLITQPAFVQIGADRFQEQLTFADPSFFNMFSITTQMDDGFTQLSGKSNIILSKETASRFFGNEKATGKNLHLQLGGIQFDFIVTGILNEVPVNSSVRPNMIVSFENALDLDGVKQAGWNSSFLSTFVLLKSSGDAVNLEAKFPLLIKKVFNEETASRMTFKLVPLSNLFNLLNNSYRMAYIMLCIAFIIVTVAVINYINLATVRSIERSREIGLRNVLGATRWGIAWQFLIESFLVCLLSFTMAIVIVQLALPIINQWLNVTISISSFFHPTVLLSGLVLLIIITVSSGTFPVLFAARDKIVNSLKGKWRTSVSGILFRRALIVFQFSLAAILLMGSVVIYRQVNFMKNFDIGARQSQVIVVPTDASNMVNPQAARVKIAGLKKELLQQSSITHVASSNIVPSDVYQAGYTMVRPEGWVDENPFRIMRTLIDESYIDLYDVKLIEGEKFSDNLIPKDTLVQNFVMINQAALKAFGWKHIDGMKINDRTQVVGLVADHYYSNISRAVEPMIFVYRPADKQTSAFLSIRFTGSATEVVDVIKSKWEGLDSTRPFTFFFIDKNFEQLYRSDDRNVKIVTWFSGLAILITCIGLLGLISFTIGQKTKEIGIRKVLGSSVGQILLLLNREFILLIVISLVIALPVATFIFSRWLQDFALRVSIHWSWYVPVVLAVLALSFAVTSIKAVKAALANPVNSLRSE